MHDVFTEYVRQLSENGDPPDLSSYDEARQHLQAILVTEMRRRGLWTSPPSYLGIQASQWPDPDGLEELVTDVYTYIFLDRLQGLANQARTRSTIDGVVVRNVRNFLTERQREADPLGYRIFTRLRKAVERLLDLGRLFIRGWATEKNDDEPDTRPRVDNSTVLAFDENLTSVADASALGAVAGDWNDALMPDLVIANGRAVPGVTERLAEHVATLPSKGVRAFRFQPLAKVLKDDARSRWHALWDTRHDTVPESGEPGAIRTVVVHPEATVEWLELRTVVLRCVELSIKAIPQAKRQHDLWILWTFVRSTRLDTNTPLELPKDVEIGRELGMRRERVTQLFVRLRLIVLQCMHSSEPESVEFRAQANSQ